MYFRALRMSLLRQVGHEFNVEFMTRHGVARNEFELLLLNQSQFVLYVAAYMYVITACYYMALTRCRPEEDKTRVDPCLVRPRWVLWEW
jgi:hypothetical protein